LGSGELVAIEDRIFTERRLRFYGKGVIFAYVVSLAWVILHGRSVIDATGAPSCIDFCTIWVSGKFAASGDPARAYDYSEFSAAQAALVGPPQANLPPYHFFYPPTFLFFTYPLAWTSYFAAYVVWVAATSALYFFAIRAILPGSTAILMAATPLVVPENIVLGQNGFLTAALIGFSLVYIERRPSVSGIFLGLLTYKPHFGVLFPLALVASRNWRAMASAVAVTMILGVAATVAFGYVTWASVIASLLERNSELSTDYGLELTLQSVFGFFHWAGAGAGLSFGIHLAFAIMTTLLICLVWARAIPYALKAAILSIGALTATPYVQIYDLSILSVAVAFLVKDGLANGFLAGERMIILLCFAGLYFLLLPVGPIIYLAVLVLIIRRVLIHCKLDYSLGFGSALRARVANPKYPH
jgi:hypothetical protein